MVQTCSFPKTAKKPLYFRKLIKVRSLSSSFCLTLTKTTGPCFSANIKRDQNCNANKCQHAFANSNVNNIFCTNIQSRGPIAPSVSPTVYEAMHSSSYHLPQKTQLALKTIEGFSVQTQQISVFNAQKINVKFLCIAAAGVDLFQRNFQACIQ